MHINEKTLSSKYWSASCLGLVKDGGVKKMDHQTEGAEIVVESWSTRGSEGGANLFLFSSFFFFFLLLLLLHLCDKWNEPSWYGWNNGWSWWAAQFCSWWHCRSCFFNSFTFSSSGSFWSQIGPTSPLPMVEGWVDQQQQQQQLLPLLDLHKTPKRNPIFSQPLPPQKQKKKKELEHSQH